MIKMVVEVWKNPSMTNEEFHDRWLNGHGALVKKYAKAMGFRKYVQSHKIPSPEIDEFSSMRGWKPSFDGLTEVWWDSMESMNEALSSPEGQEASGILQEDEEQFIDSKNISAFLSVEEVIFDFSGG